MPVYEVAVEWPILFEGTYYWPPKWIKHEAGFEFMALLRDGSLRRCLVVKLSDGSLWIEGAYASEIAGWHHTPEMDAAAARPREHPMEAKRRAMLRRGGGKHNSARPPNR